MASNGVMGKGKAPSGQQKKPDSAAGVKRTPSSKSTFRLPCSGFGCGMQSCGCVAVSLPTWGGGGCQVLGGGGRGGSWRERSVHTRTLPCLLGCGMAVTFNLALRLLHTGADTAGSNADLLMRVCP